MKTAVEILSETLKSQAEDFSRQAKNIAKVMGIVKGLTFTNDDSRVSCSYCGWLEVHVYSREDLQAALTLLPGVWKKAKGYDSLNYTNIQGEHGDEEYLEVTVYARDDALPTTCTVVEEVVVEKAQPERTYTRKVVKCDTGVEAANGAVEVPLATS